MNKTTFKKSMIAAYANLARTHEIKDNDDKLLLSMDNNLILVTSFGIIEGTLTKSDNYKDSDLTLFNVVNESIVDIFSEENKTVGNDGYIFLSDVKIYNSTNSQPFRMKFLNVFLDDIIGVTLGKIDVQ